MVVVPVAEALPEEVPDGLAVDEEVEPLGTEDTELLELDELHP